MEELLKSDLAMSVGCAWLARAGVVHEVHGNAWKLGMIAHGNEFGDAAKRAREDGCAVG